MPYPYSFIEQWWGESLTPELQKRIEAAPAGHLVSFMNDLHDENDGMREAGPKPDGTLRPLLRSGGRGVSEVIPIALNILLYAHEIIVDPPWPENLKEFPKTTALLLALKPLSDSGAIHFAAIDSRGRHPSYWRKSIADGADAIVRDAYPGLVEQVGPESFDFRLFDVLGTLSLADAFAGRANPLARDELEFKIMTAVLRAAWIDRTYFDLASLARMSIPNLNGKVADLVAVRQSDESFALWREALSRAVAQLTRLPEDLPDWQRDATEIIYSELEPLRQRLLRANSRSNALSVLKKGTSTLLIGGAGISAGWAVSGSAVPSLASSGASIGIASAVDYLRKLKERRSNKAVLDLALAFKADIT